MGWLCRHEAGVEQLQGLMATTAAEIQIADRMDLLVQAGDLRRAGCLVRVVSCVCHGHMGCCALAEQHRGTYGRDGFHKSIHVFMFRFWHTVSVLCWHACVCGR